MSVKATIALVNGPTRASESAWRQYVSDHRNFLLDKSELKLYRPEEFHWARYSHKRLSTLLDIVPDNVWIIMLINDIKSDIDLINISTLYVPTNATITDLSESFQLYKSTE